MGVIRDIFLANALVIQVVNAALVSLFLRCLKWYRMRREND